MLDAFRLIPALQLIFTSEIEFTDASFEELTPTQYKAYVRDNGEPAGRVYRVVVFEPEAIARTAEKVTLELSVASEAEKELLLEGVSFVYHASGEMSEPNPNFEQRLSYLRPRLPPIVISRD
jgi:hypothetical protein